ncbi:hypothetical protein BFW01_g1690 [Lasiodiplodia theobromae]|nr:hypothetical protein BFW01_g1690 [Lasiodiplodia theobromae]
MIQSATNMDVVDTDDDGVANANARNSVARYASVVSGASVNARNSYTSANANFRNSHGSINARNSDASDASANAAEPHRDQSQDGRDTPPVARQCSTILANGQRCKRTTKLADGTCYQHRP